MLRQQINDAMKQAMKAREAEKLDVLRFLWSEIRYAEVDAKHELNDDEVVALLRREVKKRKEAVEQYKKGGREDLVVHEEQQLTVIEPYLPQMMSEDEVKEAIDEVLSSFAEAPEEKNFGKVMGMVMGQLKGKADGATVQKLVKEKLG